MKLIPLTQGKFAMVDDEDYEWLTSFDWYAIRGTSRIWYAAHGSYGKNKNDRVVKMHQLLIFGCPEVDHINCDGLDNRKTNLRAATTQQNQWNMRKRLEKTSSKFKGVCWEKDRHKWGATIRAAGLKTLRLGRFDSEKEAAEAYDAAATRYFGEYARLNFPDATSSTVA